MKSIRLIIVFLTLGFGSWAGVIEKIYYFGDYNQIDKGNFEYISLENTLPTGKAGEPTLPYFAVKMVLPPGEKAVKIEFTGSDEIILPGKYNLYPHQPSRPLSETEGGEFMKNQLVYNTNAFYPQSQTGELITGYLNGYSIAMTTFTPVRYNPVSGEVRIYKTVNIKIVSTSDTEAAQALNNLNEGSLNKIEEFVQNPMDLMQYPLSGKSAGDYELLIITPNAYANSYQSLIDVYLARGIKTQVNTTETIYSTISGSDNQQKIRNYIIQEYQAHGIEFVLLGGDVEHVPYRGFYAYVVSGSGYEDTGIPADLYYSGLDGNWNTDGDARWGEPGEDDLLPELAVARFPFSTATELTNLIHKSIYYQNYPVLGEFNKTTLAGEWLYDSPETYGSDYLELLIGHRTDNGYETYGIPEDNTFYKLYTEVASWGATQIKAEINAGRQFIHHVGHANETFVSYLYNSDITDANFSGANGVTHNYTIMQTHGCICGSFDYNDCILEKMVNIQNFAVAVIGNSRYGWFNEGQTEGPAAHLHREMVDALYHEKMNHIGQAFTESKIQTAPWVTAPGQWEEGALRWNFYDINILGDPALSIWTDEPIAIQTAYQNAIALGTPSTQVTVTSGGLPMANFSCVIMKDEIVHGIGYTDASGNAEIVFDPVFTTVGNAELIVSGYNCLPTSYPITIIPNTGAFLAYSAHTIVDVQGNGNGVADFGETINLTLEIENVGTVSASNVQAVLSTTDSYITITDNSENYGTIAGGTSQNIANAFTFEIIDDIPDQHLVDFNLQMTGSAKDIWNSSFSIIVNAPELESGTMIISDIVSGNGNGRLDPGETADIIVPVINNGHSLSPSAAATLTSASPYITINSGNDALGQIAAGNSADAVFNITCSASTPVGQSVDLAMVVAAGNYGFNHTYYTSAGLVLEDWELGNFTRFPWTFGGNANWTIANTGQYEGLYTARSGVIDHSLSSEMSVMLSVTSAGVITFYRKVSSESGYDYLRFYIDGVQQEAISGEVAWGQISFPVTAGVHTFKWGYSKDGSVVSGSDAAWVDYIVFPPSVIVAPEIVISPLTFNVTVAPDEIATLPLTISNTGNLNLIWSASTQINDKSDESKAYCTASGTCDEYISNVVFNTINNSSACSNYADYTAISTTVNAGETYNITVTNGVVYTTDDLGVWIDWNQNEVFTDAGENVVCAYSNSGQGTYAITIPETALSGPTRMRVRIKYSGDDCGSSCGATTYGEVEDYTVIVEGVDKWLSIAPSSGTITQGNNQNPTVTFDASGLAEGTYTGQITVNSNDADEGQVVIPCTMIVASGFDLNLTAMLEGTVNGSAMLTPLNLGGYIPTTQPYNMAPWNYTGTESVATVPANVVDWVLVELRDATSAANATSATRIARQAAFILSDGSIVGLDGSSILQFTNSINQQLFAVVHHRNHLGILSANALTSSAGVYNYDFTTGYNKTYGGMDGCKEVAPGIWGMIGGDSDCNGDINDSDINLLWKPNAGEAGYRLEDLNLDGQVNNQDKDDCWQPNIGKECLVPE